ncbi:ChaN family lipoprotein [Persephonella sp.]
MIKLKYLFSIISILIPFLSYGQIYYKLNVFFDIPEGKIYGEVEIKSDKEISVSIDTGDLDINYSNVKYLSYTKVSPDRPIKIKYTGVFKGFDSHNMVSKHGLYLTGIWYPKIDKLAVYSLEAEIPDHFIPVGEAEEIVEEKTEADLKKVKFIFPYPLEHLHFIATDKFKVKSKKLRDDLTIYTYFFDMDYDFSDVYLEKAEEYIRFYEEKIGKFPYKRFSIVENILPTGYSMPTFTLIGMQIVRFPYVLKSSLGHEILHQWFGCSVYVNDEEGNWAEGLTTYLSDHLFSEDKRLYRKRLISKYMAYVPKEEDFPLKDFVYKKDERSEAIGYGKTAMVFHMLKNEVGEQNFFKSISDFYLKNKFKKASWNDLKRSFETQSGTDLGLFFHQWIEKEGIPDLKIENITVKVDDGRFKITGEITQNRDFIFKVPVKIITYTGYIQKTLEIQGKKTVFSYTIDDEPLSIIIDENYDSFRKLHSDEIVPMIYYLLGDKNPVIFIDPDTEEKYRPILDHYSEKKIYLPKDFRYELIKDRNVVIFDSNNPVIKKILGNPDLEKEGLSITSIKNPFSEDRFIFVVHGDTKESVKRGFARLRHYGGYSFVKLGAGHRTEKKVYEAFNGILYKIRTPAKIITENGITDMKSMLDQIKDKRVIFVGEKHTSFSHHAIQYSIIKTLYDAGSDIAIGMEMFQRPFQKYLDMYVNGEISEKDLLKKTEYFKRWKYDYNLYKPILRFARKHKIPIVALNMEAEIIDKVSDNGIDSLTEEEKRKLPDSMDFSNEKYRSYLKVIFQMHKERKKDKKFINFYQSQLIWDETMAQTAADYLKNNPEKKMIILAGNGHLRYGYGIPDRLYRRINVPYVIILNDEDIDKGIADYVVYTQFLAGVKAKKIGVYIDITEDGLKVDDVVKDSPADKAGIKKGDVIVEFNGRKIRTIEDLRIELVYPKKENEIVVLRDGKRLKLKIVFEEEPNHHQ